MNMHEAMKKAGIKVCPSCGREYTEHSAISRKDNKTEICPTCGMQEGLHEFLNAVYKGDIKNDNRYCKIEKCICRFARPNGNSFECVAPTDFAMPCNRIK